MIQTRFGTPVTIVARCGEHKAPGLLRPARLVLTEDPEGERRYRFVHTLRATDGAAEVEAAAAAAPEITLEGQAKKEAIRQAL